MSIAFSATHAYLYSLLKSEYDMNEGEGMSTWPYRGVLFGSSTLPFGSLSAFEARRDLAIRAMLRFERELDHYIAGRRGEKAARVGALAAVRQYQKLFVSAMDDLAFLFQDPACEKGTLLP